MTVERRRVRIHGEVDELGFPVFVRRLALELGLTGWVLNDGAGVVADVQGGADAVQAFCGRVRLEAPAGARIERVGWAALDPRPVAGFTVAGLDDAPDAADPQAPATAPDLSVTVGADLPMADLGTCDACLAELASPADRRFRHPFVSCAACGPRFTVATGLPFDRSRTTMAGFDRCDACRGDDEDLYGRRFRSATTACQVCGPALELLEAPPGPPAGQHALEAVRAAAVHRESALARAREILAAGGIVAVKGVGGYHLACDATSAVAVQRLRARKQGGDKPFAVLVPDLATAREVADVGRLEAGLLTGGRRPVVLVRRAARPSLVVAAEVAPRNGRLGLLLPPSALHVLLLGLPGDAPGPRALVLTSGNLAGEPIVTDDEEALRRLSGVADAWLRHDRDIHVACDDSVVEVVDGEPSPLRRSRGEAPLPIALPLAVEATVAAGGDLKNAFCIAEGRSAWLSAHVGDMDDIATQRVFARAVDHLQALVDVDPRRLVVDTHPLYRSARGAEDAAAERGMSLQRVQHHHAHIASVLAENGYAGAGRVLGVALDGSGHGDDGAVWGGEVLLADYAGYERLAHLSYVPLAGGDAAVRRPYRMALAHLHAAGIPWYEDLPCVAAAPEQERSVLGHQLRTGLACVPTSSMGRLFDAVASLAGVCHEAGYEGQAAMELQALAEVALGTGSEGAYPLPLVAPESGPNAWDCAALVLAVADDVRAGVPAEVVAVRFHRGVAAAVVRVALHARGLRGVSTVALSGDVFSNAVLLSLTSRGLREAGFEVLRHRRVPANDGGLALGQVMMGALVSPGASRDVPGLDASIALGGSAVTQMWAPQAGTPATSIPSPSVAETDERVSRGGDGAQ